MIDVWPNEIDRKYLPHDLDIAEARQNDITFGDKTQSDQEEAEDITDYGNLARRVRQKALDSKDALLKSALKIKESTKDPALLKDLDHRIDQLNGLEQEFNKILDEVCNDHRSSESRERYEKYGDLLVGQFDVEKVLRVERQADKNAIFNMMLDFTEETIRKMRAQGRHDALQAIIKNSIDLINHDEPISEKEQVSQLHHLRNLLSDALNTLGESTEDKEYNEALSKLKEYLQAYKQTEKATQTSRKLFALRY